MGDGLLVVVITVGLAIWLLLYVVGARSTPRDVVWLAGGPVPADEAAVYGRYLDRHRRHRLLGALLGVAFAVVIGIRWFGAVRIGIGLGHPLGDVLFCGLAGTIAGALSAETFRLSPVRSPRVTASLQARPRTAGVSRPVVVARSLTLAAVVVGALSLPGSGYPAVSALGGVIMVGLAEATRAATLRRRRPVLSERARVVDGRIRAFSLEALANLELSAAVLAGGWTLAHVPGWAVAGPAAVVRGGVTLAALVAAVILLRRARTSPPARFVAP